MVVTVLQRLVALPVVLLVIFSTAVDHGTEALEEVTMHHAFLAVVFVSHAVDGTGDTLKGVDRGRAGAWPPYGSQIYIENLNFD